MISYFKEITSYQGSDIFELLERIDLDMIFEEFRQEFTKGEGIPDLSMCSSVIKFITYCFSSDSDRITLNGDRRREKAAVFAFLKIDPVYYNDLVLLENEVVINVVLKWLRRQKNQHFEYWITLREVYVQQQAAALKQLNNGNGEIDYNQKQKCIEHMAALRKYMKEAEAEVVQNDPKYKEMVEEVRKVSPKHTTIGPENFSI